MGTQNSVLRELQKLPTVSARLQGVLEPFRKDSKDGMKSMGRQIGAVANQAFVARHEKMLEASILWELEQV